MTIHADSSRLRPVSDEERRTAFVYAHPELDPADIDEAFARETRVEEALTQYPHLDDEIDESQWVEQPVLQRLNETIRQAEVQVLNEALAKLALSVVDRILEAGLVQEDDYPQLNVVEDHARHLLVLTSYDDVTDELLDEVADTVAALIAD